MNKRKVLIISGLVLVVLLFSIIMAGCQNKKATSKNNQKIEAEEKTVNSSTEEKSQVSNEEGTEEKDAALEDNKEVESSVTEKSTTGNKTTESSSTKKETSSSSKSTKDTNITTSTNKNTTTDTSKSTTNSNSHTHNWVASKSTVHHNEEGHYENVLVKAAWTETVPVYETVCLSICNVCGADITGNTSEHSKAHALAHEGGGYHAEYVQRQTGTKTVEHPAEYKQQWVVDKAAWDEIVTTYKCSCGETKK